LNFLAHALLAGDDPALIVGGVAGDWIKGPLPAALPADLARGVALHRAIDSHAESHPAFCRSRARISASRRRYAGVLVDIYYDHLLAREWAAHHALPLQVFSAGVYRMIEARMADLPADAHRVMRLMAEQDWFSSYATLDGIADVLARMSRRIRQPNPLLGGEQELIADAEGFEEDFRVWLADARAFSGQWSRSIR
jgi:acyl carrier protein phosphodiesterase